MQVTANVECRKQVIGSLARHSVERRASPKLGMRVHSTECISKKAAPPVSPIASDYKLSEAEAIQRAGHGDAALHLNTFTGLHSPACVCGMPAQW